MQSFKHPITESNEKDYLDWLGNQLGFKSMNDWYNVTNKNIIEREGSGVLKKYKNSPSKLLMSVYKTYPWNPIKFLTTSKITRNYWNQKENRMDLMHQLTEKLQIVDLNEWYRVSKRQIYEMQKFRVIFKKYGLDKLLQEAYPQHNWNVFKLKHTKLSNASQRWLKVMTQSLFPNSELYENFRSEHIRYITGPIMELDIFLPNERLALEYQGEHHYSDIYTLGNHWERHQRDLEKKETCLANGITIVDVPFWWDRSPSTLATTILEQRPDLTFSYEISKPIPFQSPEKPLQASTPELMLGEEWDGNLDMTGWWMSEKLDGVRAYWNGIIMISKHHGKQILCPDWFINVLPHESLDGELWLKRESFELLNGMISSNNKDNPLWKEITFMVFDLPKQTNIPYEIRMREMERLQLPDHVSLVDVIRCRGNDHLKECIDQIMEQGGEGLMINKPNSLYIGQRTKTLRKVKPHQDTEVQLTEVLPTGLFCLQSNGLECLVGCHSHIITSPPEIGSIITVKYSEYYKNGVLRHPFYWRIQPEEPTLDIFRLIEKNSFFWKTQLGRTLATAGNWVHWVNRREFFDQLGNQLNYKSLDAFYHLKIEQIRKYGAIALFDTFYKGSLLASLQDVYYHHKWLPWLFTSKIEEGYWENKTNQRDFLHWLGEELGFNESEDWYKLTKKQIMEKGGSSLLNGTTSPHKLITSLFIEQQWDLSKFKAHSYWDNIDHQKEFLEQLGEYLGFKQMNDWYSITYKTIIERGGSFLLERYGDSPSKLIMSVFDDHQWTVSNFNTLLGFWDDVTNQRSFMDGLAKQLGFKQMDDWYGVTQKQIVDNGGSRLLNKHGNLVPNLIISVYHEHCWNETKFRTNLKERRWQTEEDQREFMDNLGNKLDFKVMNDWYQLTYRDIIHQEGGSLLKKYGHSPSILVKSIYNKYEWNDSKFNTSPGYWNNQHNQRKFMDKLSKEIGIKDMEDWYSITQKKIVKGGGISLLNKYGHSPAKLVMSTFIEHSWIPERFSSKLYLNTNSQRFIHSLQIK